MFLSRTACIYQIKATIIYGGGARRSAMIIRSCVASQDVRLRRLPCIAVLCSVAFNLPTLKHEVTLCGTDEAAYLFFILLFISTPQWPSDRRQTSTKRQNCDEQLIRVFSFSVFLFFFSLSNAKRSHLNGSSLLMLTRNFIPFRRLHSSNAFPSVPRRQTIPRRPLAEY